MGRQQVKVGLHTGRGLEVVELPIMGRTQILGNPATTGQDRNFVGREREMTELRSQLEVAIAGQGRIVLLVGEPGIGKTCTADELSDLARGKGAEVLWGRCWEGEGAPPYWPWVQVVRSHLLTRPGDRVAEAIGPHAAHLGQLSADIAAQLDDGSGTPALEPAENRFRMFDAVSTLLRWGAREAPLVLVLDDLHWADKPSLLLLHFLSRELRNSAILVVGTYRDAEVNRSHPLLETLGQIARESLRVRLDTLTKADLASLIELSTGVTPSEATVDAFHAETDGNPFFVGEVLRLLAAEGFDGANLEEAWSHQVPQGVKEVIGRRLNRLSEQCSNVLSTASVIGREFSVAALAEAEQRGGGELLELLDEATSAGVVTTTIDHPTKYSFSHALIRETLYEELSPARRQRLHRQVAEALERVYGPRVGEHLSELAYHFFEAASAAGGADKAAHYATRAAEAATASAAHEEAALQYRRALAASEDSGAEPALGCDLLLCLGDAESRAGDVAQARETFKQAAQSARELDRPDLLARAALGFGGRFIGLNSGGFDAELVAMLEEALAALEKGHAPLRARVLARLSQALCYSESPDRRRELSDKALRIARRSGDRIAELAALNSRFWSLWGPEHAPTRMALTDRIVCLADTLGDSEASLHAHHWRLMELAEIGEVSRVDVELSTHARLAHNLRQPLYLWLSAWMTASRTLQKGIYQDGERLARSALEIGTNSQIPMAREAFEWQMFWPRREQGLLEQLVPGDTKGAERPRSSVSNTQRPVPPALMAFIYHETRRDEEAKAQYGHLSADDFEKIPRDSGWMATVALVSEICACLGRPSQAEQLYRLLLPHAGRYVRFGPAVDYFLGRLSSARSQWEQAGAHFDAALAMNSKVGADGWLARTQFEYASMLAAAGALVDSARVTELLDKASRGARRLGMARLVSQIHTLEAAAKKCPEILAVPAFRFEKEGDYWTIAYGGQVARLRDAKGLTYLTELVRRPGAQIHVLDLLGATPEAKRGPPAGARGRGRAAIDDGLTASMPTHTGEVLDPTARMQYRRRLQELEEDIEQALANNEVSRGASLQAESDMILQELTAAYGLGGRTRKTNDVADRARKAVTNRIRDSLAKISEANPELGAQLDKAVRTGMFCSYTPS